MASLAVTAARKTANNLRRIASSTTTQNHPSSLIHRRSLAGASDHHGSPKVNCWQDPTNPAQWKEEHFVIVSLTGWGVLFFSGYKFFTGGKDKKEEKLVEASL